MKSENHYSFFAFCMIPLIIIFMIGISYSQERVFKNKNRSPFGVYGSVEISPFIASSHIYAKNRDYKSLAKILKDCGVDWIYLTHSTQFLGGREFIQAFQEQNFLMVGEILPNLEGRRIGEPVMAQKNLVEYKNSLKIYLDELDEHKMIKYWQFGDEYDGKHGWNDTPQNFALIFRIAYRTLKERDPDNKLFLGKQAGGRYSYLNEPRPLGLLPGVAENPGFALIFLKELTLLESIENNPTQPNKYKNNPTISKEEYTLIFSPDNFDHLLDGIIISGISDPSIQQSISKEDLHKIKNNFKVYNVQDKIVKWDIDVGGWLEYRFWVGNGFEKVAPRKIEERKRLDVPDVLLGFGTILPEEINERTGAADLIKTYLSRLSIGTEKIAYTGYLTNLDGSKRLEWYTHKLLAEKIRGFTSIEKIGTDLYRINFEEKNPSYILWSKETKANKIIRADIKDANLAKITVLIPPFESGREINNYESAFGTRTQKIDNRTIRVQVEDRPVLIEFE